MIGHAIQAIRKAAVLGLALALAACVGAEGKKADATIEDTSTAQPRLATYQCGVDGALTIENMKTSVRLTEPDGTIVDLPAAPASQHSRFGQPPYALVLEGKEALLMKNGKEPLTCMR